MLNINAVSSNLDLAKRSRKVVQWTAAACGSSVIATDTKDSYFPVTPCGQVPSGKGKEIVLGAQRYLITAWSAMLRARDGQLYRRDDQNQLQFVSAETVPLELSSLPHDKCNMVSFLHSKPDMIADKGGWQRTVCNHSVWNEDVVFGTRNRIGNIQ